MDPQLPTADVPLDAAVDVPLAAAVPEATEKEHTYKFEVQVGGLCCLSSTLILIT